MTSISGVWFEFCLIFVVQKHSPCLFNVSNNPTPSTPSKNNDRIRKVACLWADLDNHIGIRVRCPFYELETSSPASALKPGETMRHVQRTFHIQGPEEALDLLAGKLLKTRLETIKDAF